MTLDSAIKYKDFSNPSIVRPRPINIQMGANAEISGAGPQGAVQLILTKPLAIINAQGKNEIIEKGAVLYGMPLQSIAANKSYLYNTEGNREKGRFYVLTVGVNAELYNPSSKQNNMENSKKKKGSVVMLVGFALLAYVVYKIIESK